MYLVSNGGLFDGCEVLERRQENVAPLRSSDVFDEVTEFFAEGDEHFVLVLDRFCTK
jgi:hypothetical protein